MGVAVTFIAILELVREGLIEIVQNEAYAPIHMCGADPCRVAGRDDRCHRSEEASADDARLLDPESSPPMTTKPTRSRRR